MGIAEREAEWDLRPIGMRGARAPSGLRVERRAGDVVCYRCGPAQYPIFPTLDGPALTEIACSQAALPHSPAPLTES